MNGKLNHYNVPSIASATRSRRNISILCCLSAPVHKSLIYHIGEKKKKKKKQKKKKNRWKVTNFLAVNNIFPRQIILPE